MKCNHCRLIPNQDIARFRNNCGTPFIVPFADEKDLKLVADRISGRPQSKVKGKK